MTAVPSILVVEDNPTTLKMLRRALVAEGFAVVEAADARAALAAAGSTLPDLVLQDLILPDMDGLELLRRLRALPGGTELPVLAMSGFLSRLKEAQTNREGFTALLVKPIEPSRLIEAIGVYLPHPPALATSIGERRRLLAVDDDPVQLKLTRLHFSQLGFDVSVAGGAPDALIAARATRPDVILSDVFMPGIDGFDLCLEIRRDPSLANVPVVLVSAQYGSTADEDLARRVGASALVLRTPDFGHVAPAILEALQTRTPTPAEQPSDQLALTHARLVIHQLERQAAASAGLAQRCAIQAGQLFLLSGVADALTRRSDPEAALRDVLAATLDAAGISKGALLLRGATGVLELRQAIGFSNDERSKLQTFFGHGALLEDIVNREGSVSLPSPAIPDDTSRDILAGANIDVAHIVPLLSDGRGVGAMIIGATSKDVTREDAVAFARAMGNQGVQSLELARSVGRLTASEKRYRTLLESATDFIAVLTPDGIVREMNHRWVECTGLPQAQLIGRHVREFAPPGQDDEHVQTCNQAVSAGVARTTPVEIARSNGPSAFVEFSTTNVDVDGEPLVFAIGRDVTERQQAQAQVHLQSAALNAAANAMVLTDRAGLIEWVNPAFSELTGYSAAEAVGRNPRDLIKSDRQDQAFYRNLWETILSGQVWRGEFINRRKDDSLYTEEQTITPLRDSQGEIRHFIGVKQDITDRKRAEDAMHEAARQKDEFLALLAHELRNPLAPIRSALRLLERQPGRDPAGDRAIKVIERQVVHLVRLVDDLLDVSRTTLHKIQLRTTAVTLDKVMDDALEALAPMAEAAGHSLDLQRPETPVWLNADSVRLVQVFSNLINNAIKFTPPNGHVSISVEHNDNAVTIRVVDNGVGFAKTFQTHIFEMYSQEDSSLERAAGGLGVGLALAKALIVMHGGRIEASSGGRGLGAEFTVTLPTISSLHESERQRPAAADIPPAGRRLRVLVVDDNPDGANMLQTFVSNIGHETAIAFDGPSGLATARAFRPDLILLDIGLPRMNGYEVARAVRQDSGLSEVYLAAITGWGTDEDKCLARAAGFDIHLTKPPDLDVIEHLTATLAHTVNCHGCDRCVRTIGTSS